MRAPAKITLATLAKLATIACDDPDSAAELCSYVSDHADEIGPLLFKSTHEVCALVSFADDVDVGPALAAAVKDARAQALTGKRNAKELDASAAADRVTSSARFTDSIGLVELDATELRAALACREARVRFVMLDGTHVDVNAGPLARILNERPDARVTFDLACEQDPKVRHWPLTIRWGASGRMRFHGLCTDPAESFRAVNVPGVAFSFAEPVELEQAAE